MPVSPTESMTFTRPLLEAFKGEYEAAIKRGDYQFSFENHTFLVAYAKYVIEYLDLYFGYRDLRISHDR